MDFVEANGLRFAYLSEGEGPLVLLVHGFPDTAHTWDHVMPRIAEKGYRAVAPFLRGYHPTEVPAADADGLTIGRDVLGLIDALGDGEPAIVIAHDWGASAAYAAASLEPEKVARLFIVAIPHPSTIKPSLGKLWGVRHFFAYKLPGAAKRFAKDDFAALPAIYQRWSPAWSPDPSEFEATRECFSHPESLEAAFGYYRALELSPPKYLKAKLPMDTVCFAGTDDPIVTPADYHAAKRMFTGAYTVETMPGGHFLHREHPDTFAELLLKHL
ncbi:MAG: alpha/beta hydrolase [Sandaracinaceae bacterium]|nr:alpha/beta hydrolase [Sandaracinaceae bacterium]